MNVYNFFGDVSGAQLVEFNFDLVSSYPKRSRQEILNEILNSPATTEAALVEEQEGKSPSGVCLQRSDRVDFLHGENP